MSNDRELLEAAAKAIGIPLEWSSDPTIGPRTTGWRAWNPLTDDGDRYRLAKRLSISIDFSDCCAWKRLTNGELIQEWWGGECGDEAHAIVRAAAAIAKTTA